jgi:kynurenine formamidase
MPRKFVDLSIYLENDVMSDPPAFAPKIQYFTHENTYQQIEPFFPGLKKEDLPDGEGWAVETVTLSTHNGTHLDAPFHFHSTMDWVRPNPPSPSTRFRWSGAFSPGSNSISGTCPTAMW